MAAFRALDALGALGPFYPFRTLGAFHALGTFGPLHPLGTFGPFDPFRPLDPLVPLEPGETLGTVVAAIGTAVFAPILVLVAVFAPVLAAVFTPVGALLALGAQLDPEAIVVLAQPHALEVELPRELLDGLRDLLALLRRQAALANAHVAHAAVE